jgi:2-dehydro-3-deoxyphosphogluconate aldolase / (4S)-4-hydroxy-2-oxoglutarate aldolase
MNRVLEEIGLIGIVPVIAIEKAEDAQPLARALVEGGLPCAEVTFRTAAARESMQQISRAYPDMLLGAGTVLSVDQVQAAVDAGAKFIVSPGLNPKVVEYCLAHQIPVTPGVATPSEIERALSYGLEVVKFFPAEANGGLEFLKAISAPYKKVKFIPTGGIDEKNLLSYIKFNRIHACGGSWMVKSDMISNKQFDEIQRLSTQAIGLMLGFDLRHIGMNMPGPAEAEATVDQLQKVFGFSKKDGSGSIFVGTQFEVMKKIFLGTHGHIAIATNSVERAIYHLAKRGVHIRPETKNEKDGKIQTVYLDIEPGGFAVHLLQI